MFLSINDGNIEEIVKTWNKGFSDYIVPVNMDIESFNKRNNMLNISYEDSVVYLKEDKYIGVILIAYSNFLKEKVAWIGGMTVIKEYRNKNIASKMLKYAFEKAKANKCDKVILECISSNIKAKKLYEKMGFKIIDELSFSNIKIKSNIKKTLDIEFLENNKDLKIYENQKVSFQNRIRENKNIKIIKINNENQGYIYYEKLEKEIIIRQISEFKKFNLEIIENIIEKLLEDNRNMEIKLVNYNRNTNTFKLFKEYGLEESLFQYEMQKYLI